MRSGKREGDPALAFYKSVVVKTDGSSERTKGNIDAKQTLQLMAASGFGSVEELSERLFGKIDL